MRLFPALLHGADYNYEQWLDYPDILEEDFRFMRQARCNAMTIGIFSWAALEPREGVFCFKWLDELMDRMHQNGMSAVLATPSGSKPAWLSAAHPEVCRMDRNGRREPHGARHNHCRTSPVYREKCVRLNTELAHRYRQHPALIMWHVSNEYDAGDCFCPLCLEAFRIWLKNRYGALDELNRAWWTAFWSHTYTDWKQIIPGDTSNNGLMLDWRRFISDQTLDFFLAESAPLRRITPGIPITINCMAPNSGLDYWSFAEYLDVVSWDNYPRWHVRENEIEEAVKASFFHDLFRSLKNRSFMMMESSPSVTNWQGLSVPKKGNMHLLSSLQAVAHGSDTVQYFQWRQSRGGEEKFHGAVMSHAGHTDTKAFRDVCRVGSALEKIRAVNGCRTDANVAIIYDFQSEWALANAQLPRSIDKMYQQRCIAHYHAFWNSGIPVDIRCVDFSGYTLVVAPMLYMLRPGIVDALMRFVDTGGTLVLTYLSGLVNESDLCFLGGGPLRELLGLWVEYTDTLGPHHRQSLYFEGRHYDVFHYADRVHCDTAAVIAPFEHGALKGCPAISANAYGKGKVYYLASRNEDAFYSAFYHSLLSAIGDSPITPLPKGVTVQYRRDDSRAFAFVMNFTNAEIAISAQHLGGSDLLTGRKTAAAITLDAYGIQVIELASP